MTDQFTTSRGMTVTFVGIAPLLDKFNGQLRLPEPPCYEVKLATGGIERHIHDDTTVQTDEEKRALADYRRECARLNAEHQRKLTRLVLLRGITFDYPADANWVKEQEFLGIAVPDEPLERRLHYIETEVISTVQDIESIMLGVMRASGVAEDLLEQVEATFRGAVGQRDRHEAQRPVDAQDGSGVVLLDAIRADTDGGPVASTT